MATAVKHGEEPLRRTKVSRKNQVTLPVAAMAAAEVVAGDVLRVEVEAEGVFRLVRERDPLDAVIGSMPGLSAATNLEMVRAEWDW
ncbi:MAG: hypothetical protein ABR608_13050 [Pseudonocardiaceae bacterium]